MAKMTSDQLTKWGERYGITLRDVRALRRLIDLHADQETHVCNGDPHPLSPYRDDKNANAAAWSRDSHQTAEELTALALRLGFDRVDYGVGLYAVLEKGGDTCIIVPE